jgi:hypothetical protein
MMTRKGLVRRPRINLPYGWWIAIAQNVAPRWFHPRERRRMEEHRRRLLTSSDLPTFALAGTASCETAPPVVGEVATAASETTLRGFSGSMGIKKAGPFGSHPFAAGTVMSLHTAQHLPGGGELRFASHRRSDDLQTEPDDRQRALMIHNFLARLGLPAVDARVAWQEVDFSPGPKYVLLAVSEDAWRPFEIVIDGEPQDFERITIDDHWLALGTVDDVSVAIEGHSFDPDRLEFVRLDRPAG